MGQWAILMFFFVSFYFTLMENLGIQQFGIWNLFTFINFWIIFFLIFFVKCWPEMVC